MTDATLVADLLDSGAVRFGTFTLTSGQTSDVYVDVKRASTDPEPPGSDRRAGSPRGPGTPNGSPGWSSGRSRSSSRSPSSRACPTSIVRKAARTHGTGNRVEGEIPSGARVLVVEDVTTTGGSVVETVGLLRAAGAQVDRVVCVVDRDQGATERLAAIGVRLEPLVTLAELRGSRR